MKSRLAAAILLFLAALSLAAQRLPRIVFPVRYELTITPDLAAETFAGEETIAVTVEHPVTSFELNAADIEFDSVTVGAQLARVEVRKAEQRATIRVERPIPIGTAEVRIRYRGKLNRQLRGFYIGEANGKKYLASQMEAVDARFGFPSFDEPEFKAQFALTVVIDEHLKAISNSAVASETRGPAGKKTIRFAPTARMSSYLVALVVGDFECVTETVDNIPVGVCLAPETLPLGRFALDEAKSLLQFFNRYYEIPYPFGKLDHIGVADFSAGAMENVGAVIYRERLLIVDPKTASDSLKQRISAIISHETAHQWFGDLVTMRWWDDIWLNEGFASWIGGKAVRETHPEWNLAVDEIEAISRAISADVLATTRAIHHPAETRAEIEQIFDAIAYGKTAAVLRMLESYAGAEKFRDGINLYIRRHAYTNASAGDFASALSEASGANTGEVLNSYVKQPGVPLVTVRSRCDGGETVVDLRQERFSLRKEQRGSGDQLWTIPVCLRSGGDRQCLLLREREQTFRLRGCAAPLFSNASGHGYFITAYADDSPIRQSAAQLSAAERFVLLRDQWLLTRAGLADVGNYLALAEAVAGTDREPSTLQEIAGNVRQLERYVVTDAQRDRFQAWVRRLFTPIAREVGWEASASESASRRELRQHALAVLGDSGADAATRKQAMAIAFRFAKDPASVNPAIASTALQIAAIEGDARLYDALLQGYRTAKLPNVRSQFRGALEEFRDPRLVRRTLELALTDEVRSQDAGGVIASVLRNPAGNDIAWDFVKRNWEAIYRRIPFGAAGMILGSAGATCDPARAEEIRRFASERNLREASRATAAAAERIANCAEFRALQQESLERWLR
jgi:aminopeptidase N